MNYLNCISNKNLIKNNFFSCYISFLIYFPEFEVFEGSVDDLPVLLVLKSFETELVE